MKIGIVGLIPAQIKQLEARLPGYNLLFLSRDIESKPVNVSIFCKSVDKVILVKKFISHKTCDHVPADKRVLVPGGASMIIRRIKELMGCPIDTMPANVAPSTEIPARVFESKRMKPISVRSEPMPPYIKAPKTQPQKPQPQQSREVLTVKPTTDGKYDFSILTAAAAGDTVRFPVPSGMEVASWRTRMYSARNYYSKRSELDFVLEFHGKYADITVVDPNTPERLAAVKELEDQLNILLPKPPTGDVVKPTVTVEETTPPTPPAAVVVQPAPTGVDVPTTKAQATAGVDPSLIRIAMTSRINSEERQLWREAFMACFQRGIPATMAATEADAVLTLYRDRFKIDSPVG